MQLDKGNKGFSFSKEGPLDMRMDPTSGITAAEVVNQWPEKKLGEIIRDYGEERRWRHIAKAIVQARKKKKFETTGEFSGFLSEILGSRPGSKLHPATLVFQALRICVNHELESLQRGLASAIEKLSPGGRIGVISFHSLEDRIVKNMFRDAAKLTDDQKKKKKQAISLVKVLTKKPLVPTIGEIRSNARSRSAKMRFLEKSVL